MNPSPIMSSGADDKHRLYKLVRLHHKRRMTLQSLTVRVYLSLIQEKNEVTDKITIG